jgi:hypothetical protein
MGSFLYTNAFATASTGSQLGLSPYNVATPTETSPTGGGTGHNNLPPFAVVSYLIKT